MKKTFLLAMLFTAFAMASYGGNALLAHAQVAPTATMSTNTAALQQQLDDAKAELVQLQMQAGEVPAGDATLPMSSTVAPTAVVTSVPTLSSTDVADMNGALTALANMLVSLQAKVSQDPQFISTNGATVVSALRDIGTTIGLIGAEVRGSNIAMTAPMQSSMPPTVAVTPTTGSTGNTAGNSTGIAQTNPTTAATQPSQTAQTSPTAPSAATMPSTGNTTPAANTAPTVNTAPTTPVNTTQPQTASSFSFSKLNWPLIIVIILIIVAIAIWLWWDDTDETKKPVVVVKTNSPAPQKPVQQPQILQSNTTVSVNLPAQNANRQQSASSQQTPLSSAVAPNTNR